MDPLRLWIWNPLLLLLLAWCVQALLVLIQAGKFVRRIHRQAPDRYEAYRPPVTLIVPFKGFDHDLQRGIRALLTLDYPDYRLLAVVESEQDPAHAVLRETLASFPAGPGVEIVVAGLAPDDTGQKVHNQLAAFEHLERSPARSPTPTWWSLPTRTPCPTPDGWPSWWARCSTKKPA